VAYLNNVDVGKPWWRAEPRDKQPCYLVLHLHSCITIVVVVEVLLGFVVSLLGGTCSAAYSWCSVTNTIVGS
jgi:hypothetical protein